MPMPLYRVVAAYRTDAQEILLVLEHDETIYRVEGDAAIVCTDLEEARLAHGQGTPRLAPALLLAWREGSALGAPGSLPLGEDEWPYALPCRCLPDGRQLQCLDKQHLALLPAKDFDRRARIQRPPDALRGRLVP